MNITRILSHLPDAIKMVETAAKAATGDEEAQRYIREDAVYDGLDLLMHRGAGGAARGVVEGVKILTGGEAQAQAQEGPAPWSGFMKRLFAQKSGGHIALGMPGTGKTQLGIKLAWRWSQALDYQVEWCGLYPEDIPDFGHKVHIDTLVHRMGALASYLKAEGVQDEENYFLSTDGDEEEDGTAATKRKPKRQYRPVKPPGKRVIVIDEMGIQVKRGAPSPERDAIHAYLAQSRHVETVVIFLAQYASQIPLNVIGQSGVWVKRPVGDEKVTDRDNPLVVQCWERAEEAFRKLRSSGWQVAPHQDWRSWAYVHCPDLTGKPGYKGMVPFTPYEAEQAA